MWNGEGDEKNEEIRCGRIEQKGPVGYSGDIPQDVGNLSLRFGREEDLIAEMVGKLLNSG